MSHHLSLGFVDLLTTDWQVWCLQEGPASLVGCWRSANLSYSYRHCLTFWCQLELQGKLSDSQAEAQSDSQVA